MLYERAEGGDALALANDVAYDDRPGCSINALGIGKPPCGILATTPTVNGHIFVRPCTRVAVATCQPEVEVER